MNTEPNWSLKQLGRFLDEVYTYKRIHSSLGYLTPAEFRPDVLGGVVVLRGQAQVVPPDAAWAGRLTRTARPRPKHQGQSVDVLAIPYYAWANREPGPMQVWLQSCWLCRLGQGLLTEPLGWARVS